MDADASTSKTVGDAHEHDAAAAVAYTSFPYHLYEEFVPSPYHLCHIIWNVFLIDKEFARKEGFHDLLHENNVGLVVSIIPDDTTYIREIGKSLPDGVELRTMPYHGHDENVDWSAYDDACTLIESHRARRRNVFVFCNSGYQRSLPFLCRYLIAHHGDEVPTLHRAIDIILPQVDKEGYASSRAALIAQMERLFAEAPLPLRR